MKIHTTNYRNTLIEIAEDCPVQTGQIPPLKGERRTIANYQFEMIYESPYRYTSDEIVFEIHSNRKGISKEDQEQERRQFFSKGQACLRTSPLAKRYGWGLHHNSEGRIALYSADSEEYQKLLADPMVVKTKAMRSSKKQP